MSSICCEIIKTCPLSCLHCSSKSNLNTNRHIPFKDLQTIVNQASTNNVKTFYISGGEPFLYKELKELVNFVYNKNILPVIYSSGILPSSDKSIQAISKKALNNLENVGLDSIAFSLYSLNANIHDYMTNTQNSLITLFETLKNAKDSLSKTKIELSFIPLSDTWEEIDEMLNFANSHGIYKLNILKLINQGRAKESGIVAKTLTEEQESAFIKKLQKNKNNSTIIEISKLYDCDHHEHLQVSPHTSGVNEYFVTYNQELKKGRRFRY